MVLVLDLSIKFVFKHIGLHNGINASSWHKVCV